MDIRLNDKRVPLSFCHLNIRSIMYKSDAGLRFDHLYNFSCTENKFDVIALYETHLNSSIDSSEISIERFQLFRNDRICSGAEFVYMLEKNLCLSI